MKKTGIQILLALVATASAHALSIGEVTLYAPAGPCWTDESFLPPPSAANGKFSLDFVSGTGTIYSSATYLLDTFDSKTRIFYTYQVDMSAMSPTANHCVKLLVHFGRPVACEYEVLLITNGTGVNASSATLAPLGDISFLFGTGCLLPGQIATEIGMVSDSQPQSGTVTIIDDYTDPNNRTNETRVEVTALVPDIPPDWGYAVPIPLPSWVLPTLQGSLVTNPLPMLPASNGFYNFVFELLDGTNGLPISGLVTQTVQVVNGLFNSPLTFNPVVFMGNPVWLNVSIVGPNGSGLIPLGPPLPITPAPQAIYAYSAGVVAGLSPGQAVTSLNGLTDGVILQAGSGIILGTNGNSLTITAQQGTVSDRNLKTGFKAVKPEDILARLAALPIESWRFTNEVAGVRHVGPMAQDFKAAFGLGNDDKFIGFVDEQGVALAAIQGLNQKVNQKAADLQNIKQNSASLSNRLSALEATVKSLAEKK